MRIISTMGHKKCRRLPLLKMKYPFRTTLYFIFFVLTLCSRASAFQRVLGGINLRQSPCSLGANSRSMDLCHRSSDAQRAFFPTVSLGKRKTVLLASSSSSDSSSSDNKTKDKDDDDDTASIKLKEKEAELEFKLHSSIGSIPAEAWDACLTEHSSPFLEHAWLQCLEESKCASPQTGWVSQPVEIKINGETKGFLPLYIKGHSMGEFIFDQAWAEAAYGSGINYYPKMLVAVPFTPATGQRILWHPSVYDKYQPEDLAQLRKAVGLFLKQIAISNKVSSVHCNFLTDQEATDIAGPLLDDDDDDNKGSSPMGRMASLFNSVSVKDDFLRRSSLQYHWSNSNSNNDGKPYESFDDYLGCFKSKRRIKIKRERRYVQEDENIRIDAVCGKDILQVPGLVERMFEIYLSTIEKMYYGRQYLTLEFFQMLAKSDFIDNLCFMCARHKDAGEEMKADDVFAGTFNIVKDGVFYGRYWGCLPDQEVKNLHFEACYWSAIEFCIKNGLERMEPGAGGGDYKWARGFDPALVHSIHYICHPGLRRGISQFINFETEDNVELTDYLKSRRNGNKLEVENKSK